MRIPVVVLIFLAAATATAQWQLQDSHSKASFRGVHSLGGGVAWVSGTEGTVLRTEDGGVTWQHCAVPPGAEKLDFRGVQGFDAKTAIVMSSGKGDLSRLYMTTDGCQTWKLIFTNPDEEGFWDAVYLIQDDQVLILGDPVNGRFRLFSSHIGADITWSTWKVEKFSDDWNGHPIPAVAGQSAFAASNSLFVENVGGNGSFAFITGGTKSEMICEEHGLSSDPKISAFSNWSRSSLPFAAGPSSGAFSIAASPYNKTTKKRNFIAVGGDYLHPDTRNQTAAVSSDWGYTFVSPVTPPNGYRSAVAYDEKSKIWITVGPNGTDISADDGRNWRALKPGPNGLPDADKNWNALSLPFVVGPHGRIGVLRPSAISAK